MHIWGSSVTALKLTTFLLSWISEKPQSQLSEWLVVWTLNLFPYLAFQICIFNIHLLPDHYCGILLSILAPPQSMAIKSYSLINKCNIKLSSLPCPVYCSVFTRAIHLSLSTPGLCCHSLGAVLFSQDQCAWVFISYSFDYKIHPLTTFVSLTMMHLQKERCTCHGFEEFQSHVVEKAKQNSSAHEGGGLWQRLLTS